MILITGKTGYVGSNLFKKLLLLNWDPLTLNLRNTFWKSEIVSKAKVIVHLAGKSNDVKNTSESQEYYRVNTELTKQLFDAFLASEVKVFIMLSSVKAVADKVDDVLIEEHIPCPVTHYGKSKLLAEKYIFSKEISKEKRVYVLRPCMIHGPGNKGNLNLLHKLISKNIPWPLGAFENKRSYCSLDNLMFIFEELIEREDIPSGIYNVADDEPICTNELIKLIRQSQNRNSRIWNISKKYIEIVAFLGDKLHLPMNTERLQKLTSSYVVSNVKIKTAIGKPLPVSTREGLLKTFQSFNN